MINSPLSIFIVLIVILCIDLVVSLILSHISNYYNPSIKSTYSGFVASILGIIAIILILTSQRWNYYRKLLMTVGVILAVVSLLAVIFEFLLGFYFGAWACLVWLIMSLYFLYQVYTTSLSRTVDQHQTSLRQVPLNKQTQPTSSILPSNQNTVQLNINGKNTDKAVIQNGQQQETGKCIKCRYCCHACCSVTTILLFVLFMSISIAYFANWSGSPVYGAVYTIQDSQSNNKYYLHAYCVGQSLSNRPTIIIEHGGGSNSMAFLELGKQLAQNNWGMCAYDRLGYGRSSVLPRYLTIEKRAEILDKLIQQLLADQNNKKIIIGGWSAGVELSSIYAKLYPANVQGMLFIDGYPNYLDLMAINDNKSQRVEAGTLGTLWITRVLEPLGLGFVVGSNPIADQQSSKYYRTYYQTGYFWESQYFDVANPFDTTQWLTNAAGSNTKPYPNASLYINWPDIVVPLLILPAKDTLEKGQYSPIYVTQVQKYLDKCTNVNKNKVIMDGDHGFVLVIPDQVSATINTFFAPLF